MAEKFFVPRNYILQQQLNQEENKNTPQQPAPPWWQPFKFGIPEAIGYMGKATGALSEYIEKPYAAGLSMPIWAKLHPEDPASQQYQQFVGGVQAQPTGLAGKMATLSQGVLPGGKIREAYTQAEMPKYSRGAIETAIGLPYYMGVGEAVGATPVGQDISKLESLALQKLFTKRPFKFIADWLAKKETTKLLQLQGETLKGQFYETSEYQRLISTMKPGASRDILEKRLLDIYTFQTLGASGSADATAWSARESIYKIKPTLRPVTTETGLTPYTHPLAGGGLPAKPPEPSGILPFEPPSIPTVLPAISKLQTALEEALALRKEVRLGKGKKAFKTASEKAEYKQALSERFAKGEVKLAEMRGKGEEAFAASLEQLTGKLPKAEVDIASVLNPDEITQVYNVINDSQELSYLGKIVAAKAMKIMLTEGRLPPPSLLRRLNKVLPGIDKLAESISGLGSSKYAQVVDILNLPRAIITAFDLSFYLRQGIMELMRHPGLAAPSLKIGVNSFKGLTEEQLHNSLITVDKEAYDAALYYDIGFTGMAGKAAPSLREETFMSKYIEKIPPIRRSEQAFVNAGNYIRFMSWRSTYNALKSVGAGEADFEWMAKLIRYSTGRGDVPPVLKGMPPILNSVFFAPRYVLSRFQFAKMLFSNNSYARKEAWRRVMALVGVLATTGFLLKGTGVGKVGINPKSTDFGKIRIGNTTMDLGAGWLQIMRLTARLATGERTLVSGKTTKTSRWWEVVNFAQSKYAPIAGLINDLLTGKDYDGQPMTLEPANLKKQAYRRFMPLVIQDMADAFAQDQILGLLIGSSAFFGVGIQSYPLPKKYKLEPSEGQAPVQPNEDEIDILRRELGSADDVRKMLREELGIR